MLQGPWYHFEGCHGCGMHAKYLKVSIPYGRKSKAKVKVFTQMDRDTNRRKTRWPEIYFRGIKFTTVLIFLRN